jgi:hypothetical protein
VIEDIQPEVSQAYKDYMALADKYFENLRNGTSETPEKQAEIDKEQSRLWDLMDPEEQWQADDTVLRTTIYLQASREKH